MSSLAFLLVPLLISAIVSTVLYLRARQPTSVEAGVREFSREMRALSPEETRPPGPRGQNAATRRPRPDHAEEVPGQLEDR
ncbi:hypothetical protein BH20ACT2_BH20ACT2_10550 [soil metagenome]